MNIENIDEILTFAIDQKASDIHLITNKPPVLRIFGELTPVDAPAYDEATLKNLI